MPFVLAFLALAIGAEAGLGCVAFELVLGLVFSVVLPLVVIALFRLPVLGSEPKLQPLGPLALGHRALRAVSLHPRQGPTSPRSPPASSLATVAPQPTEAFGHFDELLSERTAP